ncbi:MAG: SH3 domain-containing protein [Chloroflexi bacterium]|nr:SH3 domain-containing protein [Chloroflexota bacterium]
MTFDEVQARFRDLYARAQAGGQISRADYEDQVSQLAVLDDHQVWWEIHPYTATWMYFDGARWQEGIPPGRSQAAVTLPLVQPSLASESPSRSTAAPTASVAMPSQDSSTQGSLRDRSQSTGGAIGAGARPARGGASTAAREKSKEWVPLALGAVVLFICSAALFFGGHFFLGAVSPDKGGTVTPIASLPTSTALSTIVAFPTQPAPSPTPSVVMAKVVERRVNVRASPSTKARIVAKLLQNQQIVLTARNADSTWYQVQLAGSTQVNWVFGETIQVISGDPLALPLATVQ